MALKLLEASESPGNTVTGRLLNTLIAEVHPPSLSFREAGLEPETLFLSENLHFQQASTDRMPLVLGPPSETYCCRHTHQPASQHTRCSFKASFLCIYYLLAMPSNPLLSPYMLLHSFRTSSNVTTFEKSVQLLLFHIPLVVVMLHVVIALFSFVNTVSVL